MTNLHAMLLEMRLDGLSEIEEHKHYPLGMAGEDMSRGLAEAIYIPAKLVPQSETAKRIVSSGNKEIRIENRYVVYKIVRRGCGHDSSYG